MGPLLPWEHVETMTEVHDLDVDHGRCRNEVMGF